MKIKFRSFDIGNDLLIIITGGDEHIGAISLYDKDSFSTMTKKGHKDNVLTELVAKMVYNRLKKDVAVICGIHIDNASKDDIKKIIDNTKKETIEWLENRD
jgi:gallate decarboxylase subunit D